VLAIRIDSTLSEYKQSCSIS